MVLQSPDKVGLVGYEDKSLGKISSHMTKHRLVQVRTLNREPCNPSEPKDFIRI